MVPGPSADAAVGHPISRRVFLLIRRRAVAQLDHHQQILSLCLQRSLNCNFRSCMLIFVINSPRPARHERSPAHPLSHIIRLPPMGALLGLMVHPLHLLFTPLLRSCRGRRATVYAAASRIACPRLRQALLAACTALHPSLLCFNFLLSKSSLATFSPPSTTSLFLLSFSIPPIFSYISSFSIFLFFVLSPLLFFFFSLLSLLTSSSSMYYSPFSFLAPFLPFHLHPTSPFFSLRHNSLDSFRR